MVSSEKTAFVWSLSVLVFTIGVTCNNVLGLSTNEVFTEGLSVKETTEVDDVISSKLSELNANTCPLNGQCQNGGSCVYEDGGNYCQCKNGTSGARCEIVDECVNNPRKCGIQQDVQCIYNITKEIAECKCSNASQDFDFYKKKCRAPCKTSKDCPIFISCRKNLDNNLRFCRCSFGSGGDRCNEQVDECKAIGYDCGINPNVTCEEDENGDAECYCDQWNYEFNYQVKDCVECNCEKNNTWCKFSPEGEKICDCYTDYYDLGEKCEACNCGIGSDGCKLENGIKVCKCRKRYLQNDDKCERCDCGDNSNGCSFQKGKKTCSCKPGYIESNGICKRICKEWISSDCVNGAKCKNSVCQCLPGTHGERCEIVDGCETGSEKYDKCGYSDNVECAFNQTSGTSFCKCKERNFLFSDYNKKCKECNCGEHGNCSFIFGSKTCECEKGYEENPGGWRGISQCSPCDCGPNSTGCRYEYHDSKVCTCSSGYAQLYDKCTNNTCGPYGKIALDEDGKKVCNCKYGFVERNGYCVECSCGFAGVCVWDDDGEETCNCDEGYGSKNGECIKCGCWLDNEHSLVYGLNCTFIYGKQKCTCPEGYKEKTEGKCTDVNECEESSICPMNTDCINTPGSYNCACKKGFRPITVGQDTKRYDCIDINECLEYNKCPLRNTTVCINTQGSYICECKSGYKSISSSAIIESEGCQKNESGLKTGYIILIVVVCFVVFGLIIVIYKRRCSAA